MKLFQEYCAVGYMGRNNRVVLKVGVPENCPGPEPRGWLDGLKRRKWYEKAQAPEIRPVMGFYILVLLRNFKK